MADSFDWTHKLRCCGLAGGDIAFDENGKATLDASSEKENARVCTIDVAL
jgi:hypothetical protein